MELAPEEAFFYAPNPAPELLHPRYCFQCFDSVVRPALDEYEAKLAVAKEVFSVPKAYRGQLPLIDEAKEDIRVDDCKDPAEAVLKLGFLAADRGFNAIIRTRTLQKKLRNHAYQTSRWSAEARPANLNGDRLHAYDI